MTINELERTATQVRRDIIRMVHGCQSGHPGGSLGATDIVTALYFDQMQIDPANFRMDGNGEDMFFLSNGHISPMLYSIMARRGYFPVSELATFRHLGTRLQGHPTTAEGLPGVRIASGSLGQGLSVAIGAAQAKKLNGDNHLVFVLMGDGEQEEGQIWEAAMYAPVKGVDNLIAIIDYTRKRLSRQAATHPRAYRNGYGCGLYDGHAQMARHATQRRTGRQRAFTVGGDFR